MTKQLFDVGDVELEVSCSLHFFKIPTNGILKMNKNYFEFIGNHFDSTELKKKIFYDEITKISKETYFMRQYISIQDVNSEVIYILFHY